MNQWDNGSRQYLQAREFGNCCHVLALTYVALVSANTAITLSKSPIITLSWCHLTTYSSICGVIQGNGSGFCVCLNNEIKSIWPLLLTLRLPTISHLQNYNIYICRYRWIYVSLINSFRHSPKYIINASIYSNLAAWSSCEIILTYYTFYEVISQHKAPSNTHTLNRFNFKSWFTWSKLLESTQP